MHRFYSYCVQLIGGMIVCLLIISFSVTLTLNFRPLYYADIQHLHIAELSGRTEEDIRQNYDALIDYNSLFNHEPLKFPTCTMSGSGRSHFEEVKKIFDLFGWTLIITLGLTLIVIVIFVRKKEWLWLRIAGILCIVLPAFLGIMVAVNWEYVFVTFHQLVFNNDYWLFDPTTDPIINILPDGYFMHCAIMIFVLVMAGSLLCFIFSHLLKRRSG